MFYANKMKYVKTYLDCIILQYIFIYQILNTVHCYEFNFFLK